jgi:hypothetical protein
MVRERRPNSPHDDAVSATECYFNSPGDIRTFMQGRLRETWSKPPIARTYSCSGPGRQVVACTQYGTLGLSPAPFWRRQASLKHLQRTSRKVVRFYWRTLFAISMERHGSRVRGDGYFMLWAWRESSQLTPGRCARCGVSRRQRDAASSIGQARYGSADRFTIVSFLFEYYYVKPAASQGDSRRTASSWSVAIS